MIRTPAAAGSFYPLNADQLKEALKSSFTKDMGPGMPGNRKDRDFLAGVVPHAGYPYSGSVAAHLYRKIAESKKIDTFVILGPNHTGVGVPLSIMTEGKWATPLGRVEINSKIANELLNNSPDLDRDDTAHFKEHSIEVQLPFLKFIQDDFKIVPICMSSKNLEESKKIGRVISEVSKDSKVAVIASSDLTHYEPQPKAEKRDKKNLDLLLDLKIDKFFKQTKETKGACGLGPITAAAEFAKERGAEEGELLKYATSGDSTGDKTSVVGYASVEFK